MMNRRPGTALCFAVLLMLASLSSCYANNTVSQPFKAGVAAVDINPREFPVVVNGYFQERSATQVNYPLMSRAIVLNDGSTQLAIVVVDNLMIPRAILDDAKTMASQVTGIPTDRMLISATHTHSAPAAMACLGSGLDPKYAEFLPGQIAKSIILAQQNLIEAKIGWTVVQDRKHNHCRRWIYRPDQIQNDPFGESSVRAYMHPGHQSPKHIAPAGPADHDLSLLAIKAADGRLMSLMGNYAMHFYTSAPISGDFCGMFGSEFKSHLDPAEVHPSFIGIMSQGTSGDAAWMDYSQPLSERLNSINDYTTAVAEVAVEAYRSITYRDWVPLSMAEESVSFQRRIPDESRLKWARERIHQLGDRPLKNQSDIYAHEQIQINEEPEIELKLQALRIGDLGITAIPNEVYAITGLKLKQQSPFAHTMNIELANGAQGYIPPPEQHHLGGYTTWPARTAGLEVQAEPRIVETLLSLLEKVAEAPRRKTVLEDTPYSQSIAASKPVAYWRFEELDGFTAVDQQQASHGTFESGVARYLPGPKSTGLSHGSRGNRAAHFAGGRMTADCEAKRDTYSVEMWLWNGLPQDARPVTGYIFSRGVENEKAVLGDHLGIGGTHDSSSAGKLFIFNGNNSNQTLVGKTQLKLKTWNHVVLVRDKNTVNVYLNGSATPEISGTIESTCPLDVGQVFFGGRSDGYASFEGKLDEVSLYDRALTAVEVADHFGDADFASASSAVSSIDAANQRPQPESQPRSPQDSLAAIHLPQGFEIELMASEPMVKDPVAIAWDAGGRLWVAEMADYPLGMNGNEEAGGRVRILEDTNNDGTFDHSHVFVDGLSYPTGVLPWKDGALITAAPAIIYAEDTDGDDRADKKNVLFDGFQERNQQLRVNGLRRGLDNWIYCASGSNVARQGDDGRIRSVPTGKSVHIGSRDFRFRPASGKIDPQSGPAQYGRNRDDWGNWFGVMNSDPLWHYVLDDFYTRRNPHAAPPESRNQLIRPRNPKVYPAKAPQKRFHNFQQSGRFTSACSAMMYRGGSLHEDTQQHGFTCEPFHNLIQHFQLEDAGPTFTAERSPKDAEFDFFASEDRWCRPVMATTGPDGALWVVDMYRYMIEHPQWLTPEGKEELKPFYRDGDDRGRIYRVYRTGTAPKSMPNLRKLSVAALVPLLESESGQLRDIVQELLIARNDEESVTLLEQMVKSSRAPLGRLHALCALDGLDALTPNTQIIALNDDHPGVQRRAIRLAEATAKENNDVRTAALRLVDSPDAKVRLQLAYSVGEWSGNRSAKTLAHLMIHDQGNAYHVAACMSSLNAENVGGVLEAVLQGTHGGSAPHLISALINQAIAFKKQSAAMTAVRGAFTAKVLLSIERQFQILSSLFNALKSNQLPVAATFKSSGGGDVFLDDVLQVVQQARKLTVDPEANVTTRIAAIPMLAHFADSHDSDLTLLAENLTPQTSPQIQLATIDAMSSFPDERIAELFLENWSSHGPATRAQILKALMSRTAWIKFLLDRLEEKTVAVSEIDAIARQQLLATRDSKLKSRIKSILDTGTDATRTEVVKQHRAVLSLTGDGERGKLLFKKKCATCHKLDGVGYAIGPNLASLTDRRPETLLTAILNPSAAVDGKYLTYSVVTVEGRVFNGILSSETGNSVTLAMADNKKQVILRNQIDEIRSTGKSMMPEGLEKDTTHQDFADLLKYVSSRKTQ